MNFDGSKVRQELKYGIDGISLKQMAIFLQLFAKCQTAKHASAENKELFVLQKDSLQNIKIMFE